MNNVALKVVLALFIIGSAGFHVYTGQQLAETRSTVATKNTEFDTQIASLTTELTIVKAVNVELAEIVQSQQENTNSLEETVKNRISRISSTVKDLETLSDTDPELLQKYSKIFFLNEHYIPKSIKDVDSRYLFDPNKKIQVHGKVEPYLEKLLAAADKAKVPVKVISGYRSFGVQSSIKSNYTVTYGAGTANQFSADQGYSEHQLGTTLDFTTSTLGAAFETFNNTPAYTWLKENAHKYGFVLSYPITNQYYQFEPWHWRFVGEDLAIRLYRDKKFFYDLDQRTIDKYLLVLFN